MPESVAGCRFDYSRGAYGVLDSFLNHRFVQMMTALDSIMPIKVQERLLQPWCYASRTIAGLRLPLQLLLCGARLSGSAIYRPRINRRAMDQGTAFALPESSSRIRPVISSEPRDPMNSVSLTIFSTSSVIVDDCETSISIPSAINSVHDSIFSATETIIRGTSAIVVMLQRTISLPHTIIDATPAIVFASRIIVSEAQTIISEPETVIFGDHQDPPNQRVAEGSQEITISVPETIISVVETIIGSAGTSISVLQIMISKTEAIISAFPTSFFGAEIIISAAEKPASAVPAAVFLTVNQQLDRMPSDCI